MPASFFFVVTLCFVCFLNMLGFFCVFAVEDGVVNFLSADDEPLKKKSKKVNALEFKGKKTRQTLLMKSPQAWSPPKQSKRKHSDEQPPLSSKAAKGKKKAK